MRKILVAIQLLRVLGFHCSELSLGENGDHFLAKLGVRRLPSAPLHYTSAQRSNRPSDNRDGRRTVIRTSWSLSVSRSYSAELHSPGSSLRRTCRVSYSQGAGPPLDHGPISIRTGRPSPSPKPKTTAPFCPRKLFLESLP